MKHKLKSIEARILKVMIERGTYLSTREIARKSEISWNTAKKYLNEFHEKGWIEHKKQGKQGKISLWKAILPKQKATQKINQFI